MGNWDFRRWLYVAMGIGGLVAVFLGHPARGQTGTPQSESLPQAKVPSEGMNSPTPRQAGGAAMADFDTLITLIQQTIDPDSWLVQGGTSTILPYPSGVFVDPAGQVRRVEPMAPQDSLDAPSRGQDWSLRPQPPGDHDWMRPASRRVVSLRALDRKLQELLRRGEPPTRELQQLAGLKKVELVRIDVAGEDVLLAGPASAGAPTLLLADLAALTALIHHQTSPLGCTIEPTEEGLQSVNQWLGTSAARDTLGRHPRAFVDQLRERIGDFQVQVFGISPTSSTALALIDADEHMKQVGFGQQRTQPHVPSYFEHLEQSGVLQPPPQSMIRWWFAYTDQPITTNADRTIFQLPPSCVRILSEQQWMTAQGRAPTGQADPAADAFARGMTERLEQLRDGYANYARICGIFEAALALQVGIEATGQPSWKAWFPMLCALGHLPSESHPAPKKVAGLATWYRLPGGTNMAVVSGGVLVQPQPLAAATHWRQGSWIASSLVPRSHEAVRPSSSSVAASDDLSDRIWWWDAE
ncbi:MAG: hypothetical protein KatS3mg111_1053 [Pirellulaceae bacterium]|nr:MAG: hypothetical protein KatS3mg111_1053 [Pirellulaceae bacterium]